MFDNHDESIIHRYESKSLDDHSNILPAVKQQLLRIIEQKTQQLRFEERYLKDTTQHGYDREVFTNLLRREQSQIDVLNKLRNLPYERQICVSGIMEQIMLQFFKDDVESDEIPSQLQDLLRIKLLTLMFLQTALTVRPSIERIRAQFFFYCCYNMALKVSSVLVTNQDMLNWIDSQAVPCVQLWNEHIFQFEDFMYKELSWNTDLVTPCEILNYFIDHHFEHIATNIRSRSEFKQCQDNIISCFLQQRWSVVDIAMGCLAYALSEDDDQDYLQFLLEREYTCFNITQIQDVISFLQQNDSAFDLSAVSSSSSQESQHNQDPKQQQSPHLTTQQKQETLLNGQQPMSAAGYLDNGNDNVEEDICLEAAEEDLNEFDRDDIDDEDEDDDDDDENTTQGFLQPTLSSASSITTLKNQHHHNQLENQQPQTFRNQDTVALNQKRSFAQSDYFKQTDLIQDEKFSKKSAFGGELGSSKAVSCFETTLSRQEYSSQQLSDYYEVLPLKRFKAISSSLDFE